MLDARRADHVDGANWLRRNHKEILATAREAVRGDDPRTAATFLTAAWELVPADMDTTWCDSLRECGHDLSATGAESPELAAVFRRSAAVYYARGDYRFAEAEGLAELAVWRELDDPDEHVAALDSLARTFLARDRLHRAMDCADERLEVHIEHGRQHDIAADLQHLGRLMLLADRPDTAVDYLTRARDAFDELPGVTAQQHARVRMLLGCALWRTGGEAGARREFSNALRVVVDVDDTTADKIRELLSTSSGAALPPSVLEDVEDDGGRVAHYGHDEPRPVE
ncbi:hypothetical protein ALI144C_00665 [Actinosynnema sp. ALI-1.44]|uniref:tetratricopeptide repeat protein n=1 Tax=Actinosynnema sp. ALI-1.44 TaxID=1933779 RepID=UPI00097BB0A5|nr:hypothetical protein [Actinosynnema sp. ALI-1.44]ONI91785.1 hypothetical protein ALI144C_00665 [Actinosynnema sp. ALI-1.44]